MAELYPPYSSRTFPSDDHPSDDGEHTPSVKDSPKNESSQKPQSTFLTKLYALLERPENQHMIRWDPQGEHIIVERPEQLALHLLPSIYRQSRFASFSRQLNIYGFMRKVNLRNVDPAIDDPDASTWSHPTLNRHSPPEVVANFKRRVPPRLPKPRKRDHQEQQQIIPPPRSAIGLGPSGVPLSVPSAGITKNPNHVGRSRGFSAPGSFTPISSNSNGSNWNSNYSRSALPPLTVPSEPHHMSQSSYGHHSLSPSEDSPTSPSYTYSTRAEPPLLHHNYSYQDSPGGHWFASNPNSSSSHNGHNGSLSSLLNPSSNGSSAAYSQNHHHSRPTPTINTAVHSSSSYSSPFSSMPLHGSEQPHSASSLSPDSHSRPTSGYSIPYDEYGSNSRPNSSHRQISPPSPRSTSSSRSPYQTSSSMMVRRHRRHSQVMSPYPSPYENGGGSSSSGSLTEHQRPSSSPQPDMHHAHPSAHTYSNHHNGNHHNGISSSLPRVRSMVQLPSDTSSSSHYSYSNSHAEFAYSPLPSTSSNSVPSLTSVPSSSSISSMSSIHESYGSRHSTGGRPGTSASSMSVASSSSQANTPPMDGGAGGYEVGISSAGMGSDTAMVRGYDHDYGYVSIENHELQSGYGKEI
ncbi:HSF-type DNA-binding-domain-containing protein [Rhodocollybia butyracea]|uniref:HSF-type DNA-binding-domain-containing protein n=1 Tax=Rhodocollybia butyracea TaxID=206335 RepID=A0A9P5Q812_9AGAR|nr:HSF-type DNA-binding-domain-containing protein [Rhodocollybia butyracea]